MRTFYSKILLFGEYSVLQGSSALTIPFLKYSGHLKLSPGKQLSSKYKESNEDLKSLLAYIRNEINTGELELDLEKFESDMNNNLYFDSDIPVNYGLGSSGAIVAAVFDAYGSKQSNNLSEQLLADQKRQMALIESFYHSESSGIDPITIYYEKPLLFKEKKITIIPQRILHFIKNRIYLYDTNIQSATWDHVQRFKSMTEDEDFFNKFRNILFPAQRNAIAALLELDKEKLKQSFKLISQYQRDYFKEMIPAEIQGIWERGISSDDYYMKLCGSGGGGFNLVYSKLPKVDLEDLLQAQILNIF
ncbi:MAG: hypothetical protein JW894_08020 [Bacteroidales bacterium]|nr:hypothetical protein [Bacteroidales bacterium]